MTRKSGTGSITRDGYIRHSDNELQHRKVWRKYRGEIPNGYHLHHINGNKKDNRIENLQLVTSKQHRQIHSGCKFIDGVIWKPCPKCGKFKQLTKDYWYFTKDGYVNYNRCKECHKRIVAEKKAQKKLDVIMSEKKNASI